MKTENKSIYTLDLSYTDSKDSRVQIIIVALQSWKEKYGSCNVNYIERGIITGSIDGKTVINHNILMNIKSVNIMKQLCGVAGIKFNENIIKYEKDLF